MVHVIISCNNHTLIILSVHHKLNECSLLAKLGAMSELFSDKIMSLGEGRGLGPRH
jgi:hypothetical protein